MLAVPGRLFVVADILENEEGRKAGCDAAPIELLQLLILDKGSLLIQIVYHRQQDPAHRRVSEPLEVIIVNTDFLVLYLCIILRGARIHHVDK